MKKPLETQQEESKKLRQIIIETDGKEIWIRKAETSRIELVAICEMVIKSITTKNKNSEIVQ